MNRQLSKVIAGAVLVAGVSACGGDDPAPAAEVAPAAATATADAATIAAAVASSKASAESAPSVPAVDTDASAVTAATVSSTAASTQTMLRASARKIVDASGATVHLKGFNLGGWFIMESFMSPMDSGGLSDTYSIMAKLDALYGVPTEQSLMKSYQSTWITETDLDNIKNAGFNAVRVPVWWGQFFALDNPTIPGWRKDAFERLDWLVAAAAARGIYVIIDMHGVIGGQNVQSTTGRANQNAYWTNTVYQSNTAWMWWQIANHYKGNAAVAGYDLINEPMGAPDSNAVWIAYANLYKSIRSADPDHMIFMEGTYGSWNWDMLPDPAKYGWTNIVYEMHEYQTNATAAKIKAGSDKQVTDFNRHASWNVPGYIGEFNDFAAGAAQWQDSITAYNNAGLSWTMWSYKAVNGVAPNPWGWYDPVKWSQRPDVSTDTPAEIARKWGLWQTSAVFGRNSALGVKPVY